MIDVTFYDYSSGKITRNAFLDETMIEANLMSNEAWVDGRISGKEYSIDRGTPVALLPSYIEAMQITQSWADLKQARDGLLFASDWTQVPDAPVDRDAWATYRQQLRDLPENTVDPLNPIWPSIPA